MTEPADEENLLRSAALQNANSVLLARKRTEAALTRKSEELAQSISMMRATLESTTDAILVTDTEGAVTDFNAKFVQMWGLPPEVVATRQHRTWLDTIAPQMDDPASFRAAIDEILAASPKESFHVLKAADGRVLERYTKIQRIGERVIGRVWSLRDVTARRTAEEAIEASEKMLSDFFENATMGLHLVGPDGTILRANRAELDLLGYTTEEYVGHSITEFHVDQPVIADILKRLSAGEELNGFEARLRGKDGTIKDVLISSNVYWERGKFVHSRCFTQDITEQKRAELVQARLAALVEWSHDAILSMTLDGIIQTWNKGAEEMFGYAADEILEKSVLLLLPEDRSQEEQDILTRLNRGEHIDHYETVRKRKDGATLDVSLTISPIRDGKGNIVGVSKIARDVTSRKQAEARARETESHLRRAAEIARDAAERANQAKDDFLAALSHELRTPLNPVLLLATDSARNMELPAATRADFESIAKNVALEARLIDDLLDLTRITRGKMPLSVASVNVHTVLKDALAIVAAEIDEKKIKVTTDFVSTATFVVADAVRLQQVFWNILRNAAKFTPPEGSITVSTRLTSDQHIEILITDTGMGMSAEEVGRLFNAFVQGDHAGGSGSHRFGGLGLGLAISRMLVELHSGRITGSSDGIGHGSTFSVQLPIEDSIRLAKLPTAESPLIATRMTPGGPPTRILLVEDHEPTRTSIKQLLIRRRYEVAEAGSVSEAMAVADTLIFDLLVTDIGLPNGDGYQLMQTLRRGRNIKGIALTGYGMQEDIERSRIAGFATHLTKPIRVQDLEAALAAAAVSLPQTAPSFPGPRDPQLEEPKG